MLGDERKYVRELAMRRILKARSKKYGLRKFVVPKLNFTATDYVELIDWQQTDLSDPPLLANIANEDIEMYVAGGSIPTMDFPKYPCHTQSVERCVKLVTEAAASVCSARARDGFIRVRLQSRQLMPTFNTKSEYSM